MAEPAGFAVLTADGSFVGIWRDRAIAEKILNRSPMAKGERIEPMFFDAPEAPAVNIADIRDQCVQGLQAEHDCPAVYALAAILAEVGIRPAPGSEQADG